MKRHPDEKVVYGVFDKPADLEHAYLLLQTALIPDENISLMMTEDAHDKDFKVLEKTKASQGAAVGTVVGGAIGGLIGGLMVLGSAMTGIGLLVVGPMVALAATGGLLGGLMGHGIPQEEAQRLHNLLHEGKAMIAVHTRDPEELQRAERILSRYHGEEIDPDAVRDRDWTGI